MSRSPQGLARALPARRDAGVDDAPPSLAALGVVATLSRSASTYREEDPGSAKSCWSTTTWWRSGIETLLIGMGAAALAFLVGFGLRSGLGVAD